MCSNKYAYASNVILSCESVSRPFTLVRYHENGYPRALISAHRAAL